MPDGDVDILTLNNDDARYPRSLRERMRGDAPRQLTALGNLDLFALPKTALFCSARTPGHVILTAYDQAARWRDSGRCVISGFHSPVEKECLRILLRGSQPIIICPARSLPERIPAEWRQPLAAGRLLILSGFKAKDTRVTAELAARPTSWPLSPTKSALPTLPPAVRPNASVAALLVGAFHFLYLKDLDRLGQIFEFDQ